MKNVLIGGIPYEFHLIPDRMDEGTEDERIGEADLSEQVIRVTNQGSAELIELTALHEMIHAIANVYHLPALDQPYDKNIDNMIDLLALGLMGALRSVGIHLSDYMEEEED